MAIDAASGRWEATDNDPQFEIEGLAGHAGEWVLVTMRLLAPFSPARPAIFFDYGAGWNAGGLIELARPSAADGLSETVCRLPAEFARARLDPLSYPARFQLDRFAVRPLTELEALDRMRRIVSGESGAEHAEATQEPYQALLARVDTSYASWIRHYEVPRENYALLAETEGAWSAPPTLSLVVHAGKGGAALDPLVDSLIEQLYGNWELWIVGDGAGRDDPRIRTVAGAHPGLDSAVNAALEQASGTYFVVLDERASLHPLALHHVAEAIVSHPGCRLVYTDEDEIGPDGARCNPLFKCELNPELLLACDMVSRLACYRTDLLRQAGGMRPGFEGAERHDLALRIAERIDAGPVVHVPRVLYHRHEARAPAGEAAAGVAASATRAVADHLRRAGARAQVSPAPGAPAGMNRVRFPIETPTPSVTIVIPTRDRADLLEACVESVLSLTTYGNFQVMIVDNGSRDPATRDLLARYRDRCLAVTRDDQDFNFSAINNRAIEQVSTEFVCLLNNDIQVVTPEWLDEMVGIASRPGVGAVGARLWLPSGELQHAGLVLGIAGFAGYAHRNLPRGEGGYASRAILQQDFSALTAACLVVRKRIYDEVGGLDESFAVAFNDVDFCLRLRAAGYRNAWTPYAEMIHDESASRGAEATPEKVRRLQREMRLMRARWGKTLYEDPCYSPNLSLDREDFSLAWPPRIAGLPVVGEPAARSGIYSRIVDAAVDSSKSAFS